MPFNANNPPPLTAVTVSRSSILHRSRPPCASIAFSSSSFIVAPSGYRRDRVCLPDGAAGGAVRDVRACEHQRPARVVAAAGVELSAMVRKGEQVTLEQRIESGSCGIELYCGFFESLLRC